MSSYAANSCNKVPINAGFNYLGSYNFNWAGFLNNGMLGIVP